jgi:FkbM family methyltransferase
MRLIRQPRLLKTRPKAAQCVSFLIRPTAITKSNSMSAKQQIVQWVSSSFNVRMARKGRVSPLLEDDVLERFLKHYQIDCVLDVGANEGQYATRLRRLGYGGTIVSFEPDPEVAAQARRAASRDLHWYVEEVALDSVARTATFNIMQDRQFSSLCDPSTSDTAILEKSNTVARQIVVYTQTLDSIYERYSSELRFKRPFLKMDTQGYDIEVAKGGKSTLTNFVGIQSELAFKKLYTNSVSYYEAIQYY